MADLLAQLQSSVQEALASGRPVALRAGNTKAALVGRSCDAEPLDVGGHRGVVDYQPDELVISARAGTPLTELEAALSQHKQVLPFEPPHYGGDGTLGGTLACNLSGPSRPWLGSIRDAVLGLQMINGHGTVLNVGGKVMKNVAGYDVSRLQAGALGTLGLITTVHLKVLPRAETTQTLAFEMNAMQALQAMCARAREPKPLTGACWVDNRLYLRLAGATRAVQHTASTWGGEKVGNEIWDQVREMRHPFFSDDGPLWRLSTAANAPFDEGVEQCIDWGGAQRWLRGAQAPVTATNGAHLTLFAGGDRSTEVRGTLDPVQQQLQHRLKQAFDPAGIFNPGRLYSWM